MSSSIVLIGPAEVIPSLRERLDSGAEMHTFTDAEAAEALAHIIRSKPRIVALDHEFSASTGGTALINRIKDDPSLLACELRVIQHDEPRVAARASTNLEDLPKPPLDRVCIRQERRLKMRAGVEVLVDGNSATIVDLCSAGAQVLCGKTLKPNQRVRLVFSDERGIVRSQGLIVWASFEMPAGEPTRYRAGISLTTADPGALGAFAERHRAN